MTVTLHHGDCLEVMRGMTKASIDAAVTDPPYHLVSRDKRPATRQCPHEHRRVPSGGFMGQSWDGGDIAFRIETWAEVLRVLKPGGHLVAFGGTRTYHRLASAIEDAGFEVRDAILWHYGSGFPKSHNVSKSDQFCQCEPASVIKGNAVDTLRHMRNAGSSAAIACGEECGDVLQQLVPQQDVRGKMPTDSASRAGEGDAGDAQSVCPARGQKPGMEGWGDVPETTRELCVGSVREMPAGPSEHGSPGRLRDGASPSNGEVGGSAADANRVCPSSGPQAVEQPAIESGALAGQSEPQASGAWPHCRRCGKPVVPAGLGTALKPATEIICLARKPLIGTVAANIAAHGTGGLNIDGTRIPAEAGWQEWVEKTARPNSAGIEHVGSVMNRPSAPTVNVNAAGRWPANVAHDGSDEVLEAFAAFEKDTKPAKIPASQAHAEILAQCEKLCTKNFALAAASNSRCSIRDALTALTHAVTQASLGATTLSDCRGLGETVTVRSLIGLCSIVITTIQSIERNAALGPPQDTPTLFGSRANVAVQRTPTDITTITISHWKSDGSADPVTCSIMPISTQSGEPFGIEARLRGKRPGGFGNVGHGKGDPVPNGPLYADSGSPARFFFSAKASRAERGEGNTHPTVKPIALMQWLCRLVTPPSGTVLDPFAGSGSTLIAADREGFNAIGIEREAEYVAIARRRIGADAPLFAAESAA